MSAVGCVSLMGRVAPGIVSVGDRSVFDFEKGLGSEVLVLDPEATPPDDDPAPLVGGATVGGLVGDDAEDFTEAVARCMAARPLALIARA